MALKVLWFSPDPPAASANKFERVQVRRNFAVTIVGTLLASLAIFAFGFVTGFYRTFPYEMVRDVKDFVLQNKPDEFYYYDTALRTRVDCPEDAFVILAMGQSQAANTNSAITPRSENRRVFNYYKGDCYRLEDPVLGGSGVEGSIWVDLAEELQPVVGQPVVVALRAKSGTSIERWLDPASGFLTSAQREAASLAAAGLAVDLTIWFQGEENARLNTSAKAYRAALNELMASITPPGKSGGAGPSWLLIDTSVCRRAPEKYHPLTEARRQAAAQHSNVFVGPDTDRLDLRYRKTDQCHFNWLGKKAVVDGIMKELDGAKIIAADHTGG